MHQRVREKLAQMGYPVSDKAFEETETQLINHQQWAKDYPDLEGMEIFSNEILTDEYFAYLLLMNEGMGTYDEETWEWSPSSETIYVFDAEFMNVYSMYTEFLLGVDAIVPDAVFTDIAEDLSGMTVEWNMETGTDGMRSVSFTCNGHPYTIALTSYGDWLNDEIISFVNEALEAEGCSGQLHIVSYPYDQCIFMIYGSETEAVTLQLELGIEPVSETIVPENLPPLVEKILDFFF